MCAYVAQVEKLGTDGIPAAISGAGSLITSAVSEGAALLSSMGDLAAGIFDFVTDAGNFRKAVAGPSSMRPLAEIE